MQNLNSPLFFEPNRVRRIYTGGGRFAGFFGDNSTEGFYPEEWICSYVHALNEGSADEKEGVSRLTTGEYFDDLLRAHPQELLGPDREELGVLVKLLDSSIRLPLQVHPDREFSRRYLHSEYGKTESWVILDAGEDACIYFGFQRQLTKQQLMEAFAADEETLLSCVNRIPVKAGDVFLIRGGAVHAIGKDCLLLEVQEPTDFTIQPEDRCGDYLLSDREKYLGLTPQQAFDCFDLDLVGKERALQSAAYRRTGTGSTETLISHRDTPCFEVILHRIGSKALPLPGPSVYVVTAGDGLLRWGNGGERPLKRGEYFFVPYCMDGKITAVSEGRFELIRCVPPPVR